MMEEEIVNETEEEKKDEQQMNSTPTDVITGQLEQPKASWFWIKNSKGESSASLTFVTIAFLVTTLSFVASMFVKIGPVELRAFDSAACAAFLGPLLTLYAFRRYTDKKFVQ